jgi:EAL domain-containing protein (putative c-di-GMP-specific phosphodiesterase class I)
MSLTSTVMPTQKNNNLVYILTDLFHDMGLNVVAEGAETEEQVEMLRSFGVDGIQGYYFAKPMSLDKLKDFLENQKKPEHSDLA